MLWIVLALMQLALSWRPELLDAAASWIGVDYQPAVVLFVLVAFVCGASLAISVVLSIHRRRIDRLTEENAILAAEVRDLRRVSRTADGEAAGGDAAFGANHQSGTRGAPTD